MLEKLGCRAATADNGKDAVTMYGTQAYGLVLMDCQMPQLDGYQATACIRAGESPPRRTPIIAMTAASTQAEREKCLAAGMDDLIFKPIRPQVLKQVLLHWLKPSANTRTVPGAGNADNHLEAVHTQFGADFFELASIYRSDGLKRITSLRQAGIAGDHMQIARVAHAFSGSCASIGAGVLSALCRELELSARSGLPDDLEQKLAAIEAEYLRISTRLQSMMASA
jgi:CheY-like chemotaxis protein/HPt (histidine-containing phosphotransfer) domain-containing protein